MKKNKLNLSILTHKTYKVEFDEKLNMASIYNINTQNPEFVVRKSFDAISVVFNEKTGFIYRFEIPNFLNVSQECFQESLKKLIAIDPEQEEQIFMFFTIMMTRLYFQYSTSLSGKVQLWLSILIHNIKSYAKIFKNKYLKKIKFKHLSRGMREVRFAESKIVRAIEQSDERFTFHKEVKNEK